MYINETHFAQKKTHCNYWKAKIEICRTCHIVRDILAGRNFNFKSFTCHIYYNRLFGMENLFVLTKNRRMESTVI